MRLFSVAAVWNIEVLKCSTFSKCTTSNVRRIRIIRMALLFKSQSTLRISTRQRRHTGCTTLHTHPTAPGVELPPRVDLCLDTRLAVCYEYKSRTHRTSDPTESNSTNSVQLSPQRRYEFLSLDSSEGIQHTGGTMGLLPAGRDAKHVLLALLCCYAIYNAEGFLINPPGTHVARNCLRRCRTATQLRMTPSGKPGVSLAAAAEDNSSGLGDEGRRITRAPLRITPNFLPQDKGRQSADPLRDSSGRFFTDESFDMSCE